MLKVLFVNTSDHAGGAAIAACRLLKALRLQGVDAKMLCATRSLSVVNEDIIYLKHKRLYKLKFLFERLEIFIKNGFSRRNLFAADTSRFGNDITKLQAFKDADIIHLHWINQAMLSMKDIERIMQTGKPVVWTMHDMWNITGVCHQAGKCKRWQQQCEQCEVLCRPSKHDLSYQTFRRKQRLYNKYKFAFVGCSQWLASFAKESPLLQHQRVESIPNAIDTSYYAPLSESANVTRNELRKRLGLPTDKLLILFTAFKVTDPNKGIDYLIESISLLCQEHPELRNKVGIVLAGQGAEKLKHSFAVEAYPMGYVANEERMLQLYQTADLLAMPTLMDNLPNTIAEAMACGVPCVAFSVGGVPQMIDAGVNGYLAAYQDSLDFAHGIAAVLLSPNYESLCRNARAKAVNAYSEANIAQKYINLYRDLLNK